MIVKAKTAAALAATIVALAALPAYAQDEDGSLSGDSRLPRDQRVGLPAGPTADLCRQRSCVFLVNVSNHRVTEFRYATARDSAGGYKWSGNQFAESFDFSSKKWTAWYEPRGFGCRLALKVVMKIDGKSVEQTGEFDICANPRLLFYINDPTQPTGTVTLEASGPATP